MCACVCVCVHLCRAEGGVRTVVCQGRAATMGGEPGALGLTDAVLVPPHRPPRLEQQKSRRDKSKQVMVSLAPSPPLSTDLTSPRPSGEHLEEFWACPQGREGFALRGGLSQQWGQGGGALYAEQGVWQCQAGNQCTGAGHGIQWGRRGCRAATGGSRMQDSGQRRGEGRQQGPGRGLLAFLPPCLAH